MFCFPRGFFQCEPEGEFLMLVLLLLFGFLRHALSRPRLVIVGVTLLFQPPSAPFRPSKLDAGNMYLLFKTGKQRRETMGRVN
ncbi:Hypothetical protein NTJ_02821 [Nesidiocoris tenuis]|uniref:Secreted protein n=1 Tax=Nesidiocoris tenuis TaxID=355587 RepID=A0ABN7AFS0_9HEMI|nr:Hypothetical protein NTJ_02821 [Nesidiocoris tenuis]